MATKEQLDNFDRAFSHFRTNVMTCDCGKRYFDWYNSGYDWQDGELEELQNDQNSYGCDYAIDRVEFDGKEFANACDCWHANASKIIAWLECYGSQIADFLSSEKRRKISEAKNSPTVN